MNYLIPLILIITVIASLIKKVPLYDGFIDGTKDAMKLTLNLLPFFISIFIMLNLFNESGINEHITKILETPLSLIGIPKELIGLLIIRPISGSGSIAILEEILSIYGADSYIGRCASVICGCNDTIFFIVAVYTAKCKEKNTFLAIPLSIIASFFGVVVGCFICRFI